MTRPTGQPQTETRGDNPYRLLGITNRRISPFGLLGVSPEHCNRDTVMRALQNQLARLDRHPESQSADAHRLRRELRKAADQLLTPGVREELEQQYYGPAQQDEKDDTSSSSAGVSSTSGQASAFAARQSSADPSRNPLPGLKPVAGAPSREATQPTMSAAATAATMSRPSISNLQSSDPVSKGITMAIASAGGWNLRARRRVAAVALQHQLKPDQLVRRVLDTVQTSGIRTIEDWKHPGAPVAPMQPAAPSPTSRSTGAAGASANSLRGLRADDVPSIMPGRYVPASAGASAGALPVAPGALSGLDEASEEVLAHQAAMRNLGIALAVFFVGLILTLPFGIWVLYEINSPARTETKLAEETGGESVTGSSAGDSTSETGSESTPAASGRRSDTVDRTGRALPLTYAAALDDVDQSLRSEEGLSDETLRRFGTLIEQARHGWPRFELKSLERIRRFVVSALYEKGTDEANARRLMEIIDPLSMRSASTMHASLLPGRIWSDAMLSILSAESGLPTPTRRVVEEYVRRAGDSTRSEIASGPIEFRGAANRALESMTESMSGPSIDQELWIAWAELLQHLNPTMADREAPVSRVLYRILAQGPELSVSDSMRQAVVAVMQTLDWSHATEARRSVLAWLADPRISAADLAVVTGYLAVNANLPGVDESCILPADAGSDERARLRERLASAWRVNDDARGPMVADSDVAHWLATAEASLDSPVPTGLEAQLEQLLLTARLSEAAVLLEAMDVAGMQDVLESRQSSMLDAEINAVEQAMRSMQRQDSGEVFGGDGRWAIRFAAATRANDREGRENLLEELQNGAEDDLGPVDAAALVDLALTGSPRTIRQLAIDTIASRFAGGPTVLRRLIEMMSADQASRPISDMIERITARILPDIKSTTWFAEARFALVTRVLELMGGSPQTVRMNAVSALIARSYAMRAGMDSQSAEAVNDPADGALRCAATWENRARPMIPRQPVPAPLSDLIRRRETRLYFQRDPIGRFDAAQMSTLELMVYVTAAERPMSDDELNQLLETTAALRVDARTSIEQLLDVERAMLRVWMLRIRYAWGMIR